MKVLKANLPAGEKVKFIVKLGKKVKLINKANCKPNTAKAARLAARPKKSK